jgi:hypothetical protein
MEKSLEELIVEFQHDKDAYGELTGSLYPRIIYHKLITLREQIRARGVDIDLPPPPDKYGYAGRRY